MIPSSVRIYLCTQPQDMRCSFDALALAARRATGHKPTDGQAMFCFVNRRKTHLKVLWFEPPGGYCILYKRLHGYRFDLEVGPIHASVSSIDQVRFARLVRGVEKALKTAAKNRIKP